ASGGWDRKVRLWDAATGEPWATLPHPGVVWDLAFGPDGRWLVSGTSADNRLRIWDVATACVRKEIQVPAPSGRNVTVSPEGKRIAATTFGLEGNQGLHVFDFASCERLFSAEIGPRANYEGGPVAYSPDGRWLASLAADDKTVLLLD